MRPFTAALAVLALAASSALAADTDALTPFNGKNLEGWKLKGPEERSRWTVGVATLDPNDPAKLVVSDDPPSAEKAELVNTQAGGIDISTEEQWGDIHVSLEVMVPKGSNSGVYLMGEYEVQILDSYGKEQIGPGDIGGLYSAAAPRTNAARKPGEWQTLEIEFQAPRFQDGQKTSNALFKRVTLNGEVIHENVEMKGPTPSGLTGKEAEQGPLMFQGDHGPIAYRNIRITPHD